MTEHVKEIVRLDDALCFCGCGNEIAKKRHFIPGHDQRLMGYLLVAHRANGQIRYVAPNGGGEGHARLITPEAYARLAFSENGVNKYLDMAAAEPKTKKTWSQVRAALTLLPKDDDEEPGDEDSEGEEPEIVMIKLGRNVKEARVTRTDENGQPAEVEYDSGGEVHVTEKFKLIDASATA